MVLFISFFSFLIFPSFSFHFFTQNLQNSKWPMKPPNFKVFPYLLKISIPFTFWPKFQHKLTLKSSNQAFSSWTLSPIPNFWYTSFEKTHDSPKTSNSQQPSSHLPNHEPLTFSKHLPILKMSHKTYPNHPTSSITLRPWLHHWKSTKTSKTSSLTPVLKSFTKRLGTPKKTYLKTHLEPIHLGPKTWSLAFIIVPL